MSSDSNFASFVAQGFLPMALMSGGATLTVGAGGEFSSLSAAVGAAHNGDVILVQAGTYTNDFATVTASITIEGVGGIANFVATRPPPNFKGILTVDNNVTVENCSFSGCAIPQEDGGNGAGIRYEGGAMVLENDSFANNQNGIMGSPVIPSLSVNTISIDHCLFRHNGAGDGYTHNCYIGAVSKLTFTNSISEGAVVGHELKSRAAVNIIENNVFKDGGLGSASYEVDLPNGGADTILNNVFEKGPLAQNQSMIHFGGEGIPYAGSSLLVSGNRFIDRLGPNAFGVFNQTPYSATITGNIFIGMAAANIAIGPAVETRNTNGHGVKLADQTLTGVLPGNTVIYTDSAAHSLTLTGTILAVEGGGGLLTATAIAGHVVAIGGSGGMNFTEVGQSGGNTITTAAGTSDVLALSGQDLVQSAGTDTIQSGACNVTGQVTGTATITDGTGNNQWSIGGTATITGTGGNPVLSVGGTGNATVLGTVGYLAVNDNGGQFSIDVTEGGNRFQMTDTGGALNAQVSGATMSVVTSGGPIGATLQLGAGTALVTSAGADSIYAGSGNDTVIVQGAATVHAGTGSLSVYGRGDQAGANVYGNGGTILIAGDTGNITYHGGSQAGTVQAQLSRITLLGGAGQLTVQGGSDEVMRGGAGGLVYTATDGGGANQITTTAGATDTLTLAAADTLTAYGNDLINAGTGNQDISAYGNTTVNGSTGNSRLVLGGIDTLNGVGQDSVTVLQGATATINAGQSTWVTDKGASSLSYVVGGGGTPASVRLSGGGATIAGGQAVAGGIAVTTAAGLATTVDLTAGSSVVVSQGADTINAGAGPAAIYLNEAGAQVTAGAGALSISNLDATAGDTQTVIGGSGAITFSQAAGSLHFLGGSGSAVIDGGSGSLFVTGGSGSLTLIGGTAGLDFTAGSGFASVSLPNAGGTVEFGAGTTDVQVANWGAGDVFQCVSGHGGGTDTITGFRAGIDSLVLNGVQVASEQVAGGSTELGLTDGTTLILAGFTDTAHL